MPVTPLNTNGPKDTNDAMLPRRDWIVLPLLGLLTIGVLATSTELIARRMLPSLSTVGEDCMVLNDPLRGARGIPNSVCMEKLPESEFTEYRFNSCGYRAGEECGRKPPGTYRIVLIGASFAIGMRVPREETFAALLPAELSWRTGLKVDLYNEGMPNRYPDTIALHFDEVLKAKPDMILWVLTTNDVVPQQVLTGRSGLNNLSFSARAWRRIKDAFASKPLSASIAEIFGRTRTSILLSQLLYSSQRQYLESSLLDPGKVEYLKANLDLKARNYLKQFDRSAASIEAQSREAGVPLVAVLLPLHVQASMLSMGDWPAGYDPYKIDEELRSIITSHGGAYIDILPGIAKIPDAGQLYLAVDGHANAKGNAVFSKLLADQLTKGAVPALKVAARPEVASAVGQ